MSEKSVEIWGVVRDKIHLMKTIVLSYLLTYIL